jgi:hypothetical protein
MDSAPEPPETSQTAIQLFQEELGELSTVIPGLNQITENNSPVPSEPRSTASQCSQDAPRLLFSIRLQENIKAEDLSVEYFAEWLRIIPAFAKEVTVEGVFKSDSTLLLLGLPFSLWPYLSPHPAVINLGPIRSPNILFRESLNHWPIVKDGGIDFLPVSHLDNDMAHPDVATMNYCDWWFRGRAQEHPESNNGTPKTENVSSSAPFWATPGQSSKIPFDLDATDDDNESDLWSGMPSTYSETSTEYPESIFDSVSLHSRSQGGLHFVPIPRRRLSLSARVNARRIRLLGACWRCRLLLKPVSTNTSNKMLL